MLDLAVLKAEIDYGLDEKPIDELAKEFQYEPLPDEVRAIIIAVLQRGGLLPKPAIEEMMGAPATSAA